jgi:MoaA/NifB/PqqE/SkfB family radical SAM enzyme
MAEIKSAKMRGTEYLELIGGEMTIRKDFIKLLKFSNKLGFNTIMIATNGRMFAYKDYAKKAIEAGLNSVVFSIHGHNSKLHDDLTRVRGSFEQLHSGLKNIKKSAKELGKDIHIGSNTTIVKPNYRHLEKIGKFIRSQGIKNSEFIFVDCNEGGAYNNFKELVPKISDAAPYIRDLLDVYKPDKDGNWDVRYVPICYFKDHLDRISEIKEKNIFKTEHLGKNSDRRDYNYEERRKDIARIRPKKCEKCILYDFCEGLWKNYYQQLGDEELKPIKSLTAEQEKKLKSN